MIGYRLMDCHHLLAWRKRDDEWFSGQMDPRMNTKDPLSRIHLSLLSHSSQHTTPQQKGRTNSIDASYVFWLSCGSPAGGSGATDAQHGGRSGDPVGEKVEKYSASMSIYFIILVDISSKHIL